MDPPPFLADIICGQPLTKKNLEYHESRTTNHTLHIQFKFVCFKKLGIMKITALETQDLSSQTVLEEREIIYNAVTTVYCKAP